MKKYGSPVFFTLPVVFFILIAAYIRTRINFSSEMIPGINGGYYPLLVRNFLEFGSIRYPDTPLVYWIQALISLIIRCFSGISIDQSVLLASRIFDSFVPPLTCLPVFLLAREHLKDQRKQEINILLIAAFSIFYLSFLIVLTAEMQKNAAGLVLVACYLFSFSRINSVKKRKYLLMSLLFLILVALTHIGCFAVAFLFTLIYGCVYLFRSVKRIRLRTILIALSVIAGLVLISFAILARDPDRMHRVISIYLNPLRIFESPYLFVLISGQQVYFGFLFHNFLLINALSIFCLIIIIMKRKNLSSVDFSFALSLSALSLLLSSPLIGMEWALRYYLMAFLPLAFTFIFVFKSLTNKFLRNFLSSLLLVIVSFSIILSTGAKRNPAISSESFADLKRMKSEAGIHPDDLIIARHGLEWWTGWVMHCRTGKEYCLRPGDWEKYPKIYLLRQKTGNNYPGQQGSGQFAEYPLPQTAEKIYTNESFDFYRLSKPTEDQYYPGNLPLIQGEVRSVLGSQLQVHSEGYRQCVILSPGTQYIGCNIADIKPGMRADVWGRRVPFSLDIRAERIKVYSLALQ
jgi:hypothetical protein